MIHSIAFWWILTSFAFWKTTLVIIPGLMYQWTKENSATEAITKRIHFLTGMLNKRDTEDLFNQEKHWSCVGIGSAQSRQILIMCWCCFFYIKLFQLWIIWFNFIASVTKRVIELGLGLGLQLGLGFVNNNFIDIVACWMKCCCIRIRNFCLQEIYVLP